MRLINAGVLIEWVENVKQNRFDKFEVEKIINFAPTIDAVEVVRCKDCRRHKTYNCPFGEYDFPGNYMYCYYGERREP